MEEELPEGSGSSSGELEETVQNAYIISSDSREKADALYEVLSSSEGVEIQRRYRFIPAIAARIEDAELLQRLRDNGYRIEPQHRMRSVPVEHQSTDTAGSSYGGK